MGILKWFTLCVPFFILLTSCSGEKKDLEEEIVCDQTDITYTREIKPILDQSCAFIGCHDGSSSAPVDYRSYETMYGSLISGEFKRRVIDFRNMPIQPDTLSALELDMISCWIQNDYAE